MTKLNAREVESALEAKYEDEGSYFWSELEWWVRPSNTNADQSHKTLEINGVDYDLSVVEEDTGGEGHGEYVFIVIKVGEQLFRKEGYYASHYGTDWDGPFSEVEAFEKTVTDYRVV